MVKYILIGLSFFTFKITKAQSEIITPNFFVVRQGLSIDANKSQHVSLHLGAEYFTKSKLSIVGEGNVFLAAAKSNQQELLYSHSTFSGFNYHKTNQNIDLYIGFQPGINISKKVQSNLTPSSKNIISPLISVSAGFSYYSTNYFHFYTQARYIHGSHLEEKSVSLSGFRFTFGLGYNLSQILSKK